MEPFERGNSSRSGRRLSNNPQRPLFPLPQHLSPDDPLHPEHFDDMFPEHCDPEEAEDWKNKRMNEDVEVGTDTHTQTCGVPQPEGDVQD